MRKAILNIAIGVSLIAGLGADGTAAARDDYRGGYHHHQRYRDRDGGGGAAVAAGVIGLIAGAAIASSGRERYDPPPAPMPYGEVDPYFQPYPGGDFRAYCARKYSTYDPRDGRYLAQDGRRYPCH